jgi:hypothetical protein
VYPDFARFPAIALAVLPRRERAEGIMGGQITKSFVDRLKPRPGEYTVYDGALPGFGVRVRPSGAKSYVVVYRAGAGRGTPVRRFLLAAIGKITPEAARRQAKAILGAVAHGNDPAADKATERSAVTVGELADRFMSEHVEQKRKPGTVAFYRHLLDKIIRPALGATKADKLTRGAVARLHGKLRATPYQANRVLAVIGSMYVFGSRAGRLQSLAADREVQGATPRALPDRR